MIVSLILPTMSSQTAEHICTAAAQIVRHTRIEPPFFNWADILIAVIPHTHLSRNLRMRHMLLTLFNNFATQRNAHCRKLAARIISPLANALPNDTIADHMLHQTLSLMTDTENHVRSLTADSCQYLLPALHSHTAEPKVWPRFITLLRDQDYRVHATALRSIANIVSTTNAYPCGMSHACRSVATTVFVAECLNCMQWEPSSPRRRTAFDMSVLMRTFAEAFAPMMHALFDTLTPSQKDTVLYAFVGIATCKKPVIRRACAFNFPAVCARFGESHPERIAYVAKLWVQDDDLQTRHSFVAGIHLAVRFITTPRARELIIGAMCRLLADDCITVRLKTVERLHDVVSETLRTSAADNAAEHILQLLRPLQSMNSAPWRAQFFMLSHLEKCIPIIPSSILDTHVLPFLLDLVTANAHVVRTASMNSVAAVLRHIPEGDLRNFEVKKFSMEWAQARECWKRSCYIDCVQAAYKLFTRDEFSRLFFVDLFLMAMDTVPNIRIKVARTLKIIEKDFGHTDAFRSAAVLLGVDDDYDVRHELVPLDTGFAHGVTSIAVASGMFVDAVEEQLIANATEVNSTSKSLPARTGVKTKTDHEKQMERSDWLLDRDEMMGDDDASRDVLDLQLSGEPIPTVENIDKSHAEEDGMSTENGCTTNCNSNEVKDVIIDEPEDADKDESEGVESKADESKTEEEEAPVEEIKKENDDESEQSVDKEVPSPGKDTTDKEVGSPVSVVMKTTNCATIDCAFVEKMAIM